MKKPKKKKIKWHFDRAWKQFSLFIRRRDKGKCFTCGVVKPVSEMQAGHFHHNWIDFNLKNVHCQCPRCNKWLHGNAVDYSLALQKAYGEGILQTLEDSKICHKQQVDRTGKKYDRDGLDSIYEFYLRENACISS